MLTFEFAALFALATVLAGASLMSSLRGILPRVEALRQALDECPEQREVRFTLREIVVSYDDGKVVPLRQRRETPGPALNPAARAAA